MHEVLKKTKARDSNVVEMSNYAGVTFSVERETCITTDLYESFVTDRHTAFLNPESRVINSKQSTYFLTAMKIC